MMFFYSALYTITSMKYGLFHLQYMNILNKTSAVLKQNIARIPPATIARIPPATIARQCTYPSRNHSFPQRNNKPEIATASF